MRKQFTSIAFIMAATIFYLPLTINAQSTPKGIKNIVLVHGAFADGSSWAKVIPLLQAKGYNVITEAGNAPKVAGLLYVDALIKVADFIISAARTL